MWEFLPLIAYLAALSERGYLAFTVVSVKTAGNGYAVDFVSNGRNGAISYNPTHNHYDIQGGFTIEYHRFKGCYVTSCYMTLDDLCNMVMSECAIDDFDAALDVIADTRYGLGYDAE